MSLDSFISEHEWVKILEPSMFCKNAPVNPNAAARETLLFHPCYLQAAGSQIPSALTALPFRDWRSNCLTQPLPVRSTPH